MRNKIEKKELSSGNVLKAESGKTVIIMSKPVKEEEGKLKCEATLPGRASIIKDAVIDQESRKITLKAKREEADDISFEISTIIQT